MESFARLAFSDNREHRCWAEDRADEQGSGRVRDTGHVVFTTGSES